MTQTGANFTPPIRRVNRGNGHSYLDANDAKVPGVTTIINDGLAKPGLIAWAANATVDYAIDRWSELSEKTISERIKELKNARFSDRDAAARRGTEVHNLAERLALGEEVEVPDELAGHVESYVNFLNLWEPQVVLTESTIVNHHWGYAGTLDLIATIDGETWLLDTKTNRSRVYGDVALQLSAYARAERYVASDGSERPMPHVQRCGVVWTRSDGFDLIPITVNETTWRTFLYCKQLAHWANDVSKTVVGESLVRRESVE